MKNKGIIITTLVFFLLVNTTYFWENKLGLLAFPAFLFLVLVFLVLLSVLLQQFFFAIKEKFAGRQRLLIIVLLAIVLGFVFLKPDGLIAFNKFDGNDILVAEREGAANCMTTFKLKENNKFTEKSVCFGMTEIKGNYKIINDTIYFENVETGRDKDEFYMFAVIRPSKYNSNNYHFDIVRYKDLNDTT